MSASPLPKPTRSPAKGSTLSVLLRDGRTLNFPFQSEDVLTEFFDEVIVPAGDKPIRLQFTAFAPV